MLTEQMAGERGESIKKPPVKGNKPGVEALISIKAPAQGGEAGDDLSRLFMRPLAVKPSSAPRKTFLFQIVNNRP